MKKLIASVFIFVSLALPSISFAAIAFDVGSAVTASGSGTSLSFTSGSCSGSNLMGDISIFATANTTVTGTWGGTALVLANKQTFTGNTDSVYHLYVLSPPTGTQTISLSFGSSLAISRAVAGCYTGINQTGQPDATGTNVANANADFSVSVTTIANNSWVIGSIFQNDGTLSALTGSTIRGQIGDTVLIDSNQAVTPAGAYSIGVHPSSSANESMAAAASFSPAPAAAGFINGLHWNIQWLWK